MERCRISPELSRASRGALHPDPGGVLWGDGSMELTTIESVVLGSVADDWEQFDPPGLGDEDHHDLRATYRPDIALELWWGRTIHEIVDSWTSNFPDRGATSFYLEATYGGSLVIQETVVTVDGGRYYLPLPTVGQPQQDVPIEYHVTQREMTIVRVLDRVAGSGRCDPDSGIKQAGFVVVD